MERSESMQLNRNWSCGLRRRTVEMSCSTIRICARLPIQNANCLFHCSFMHYIVMSFVSLLTKIHHEFYFQFHFVSRLIIPTLPNQFSNKTKCGFHVNFQFSNTWANTHKFQSQHKVYNNCIVMIAFCCRLCQFVLFKKWNKTNRKKSTKIINWIYRLWPDTFDGRAATRCDFEWKKNWHLISTQTVFDAVTLALVCNRHFLYISTENSVIVFCWKISMKLTV